MSFRAAKDYDSAAEGRGKDEGEGQSVREDSVGWESPPLAIATLTYNPEEMPPEQAANVPPLKTRKRNNTTPVHMKITYTCHHAGKYDSTHSDKLPQGKLRMKTKQSVKCKCTARIMFTVLHSGECQTIYYWKHDGHGEPSCRMLPGPGLTSP